MNKVLLAVALTLVGCGPVPSPSASVPESTIAPDFVVNLVANEGITRPMTIYDAMDLLTGARIAARPTSTRGSIWWDPLPGDPKSLVVAWLGGICGVDPTLEVTENGSEVSVAVFEGHQPDSSDVCADAGIIYAVALTFGEPISDFDVVVSYSEEAQ